MTGSRPGHLRRMVPVADVAAILDVTAGATLHLPDSGDRYLSVMVVNQDHYLNAVHHDAGGIG